MGLVWLVRICRAIGLSVSQKILVGRAGGWAGGRSSGRSEEEEEDSVDDIDGPGPGHDDIDDGNYGDGDDVDDGDAGDDLYIIGAECHKSDYFCQGGW